MHKLYSFKKVKKILIATNNPGKFIELKEILPRKIKYFKPKDFKLKEPEDKTASAKQLELKNCCLEVLSPIS